MTDKITYILPIETVNREFDYKLLLAARLKSPSRRFIICRRDLTTSLADHIDRGMFVSQSAKFFPALKDRHFGIVHIMEEGGVYPGDEDEWRHFIMAHVAPPVVSQSDATCTWGTFQKEVVEGALPDRVGRVFATGHPRLDLCMPAQQSIYAMERDELRCRLGEFVLVNTNYGMANHVAGHGAPFLEHDGYSRTDPVRRLRFVEQWRKSQCGLGEFVAMVHQLSVAFPTIRFVVRPHPSEDWGRYRAVLKDLQNVIVEHSGNVIPWILAARVLIHNGCTTGLEAHLAAISSIAYLPPAVGSGEAWLPNVFSWQASSVAEVGAAIERVLQGELMERVPSSDEKARASKMIRQLDPASGGNSFDRVVDVVMEVEGRVPSGPRRFESRGVRLAALRHAALSEASRYVAGARERWRGRTMQAAKFPALTEQFVAAKIQAITTTGAPTLAYDLLSPTCAVFE